MLRVYLDRPWLVTGDGEELAVVIDPSGSTGTVLGRDPIVPGAGRTAELTTADFPRAKTVIPSLDGLVAIVGHEVSFDADSGRWYSDIELGGRVRLPALSPAHPVPLPARLDPRGDGVAVRHR